MYVLVTLLSSRKRSVFCQGIIESENCYSTVVVASKKEIISNLSDALCRLANQGWHCFTVMKTKCKNNNIKRSKEVGCVTFNFPSYLWQIAKTKSVQFKNVMNYGYNI